MTRTDLALLHIAENPFTSVDELMSILDCSRSSAYRILNALEAAGEITATPDPNSKGRLYSLNRKPRERIPLSAAERYAARNPGSAHLFDAALSKLRRAA